MSAVDPDQPWADGADEAIVEEYVRRRFGIEPREDRSGLFTGKPAPMAGEYDEEAQFQAYMRRYFPGTRE